MNIKYNYVSENGDREINEDCVSVAHIGDNYCFTLCDGLGGHGSGDIASLTVTDTFATIFEQNEMNVEDFFSAAYKQANEKLLAKQAESGSMGMKTTAVCLVIKDGQGMWSHIGDSRLYCFEDDKVKVRTLDHSVPQMLVKSKEIKEEEIRFHPDRNKLLRAMGSDDEVRYEVSEKMEIRPGQAFLLCSDGFWELITEKEMMRLLKKSESAYDWLRTMKKTVVKKGRNKNMDNFSAVAVIIKK